ncbi:gluconate 2-dehydrogenase subunit 3 family protein, partial [Mycobacterium kansasii]
KLADGRLDGYQYADMPDDRDTWRLVLRGLDETAARYGASSFAAAGTETREQIVGQFSQGEPEGGAWENLNVKRAWSVC